MNPRAVLHVALFDLRESLRSRKVIALLILYALGAGAAARVFAVVLERLEELAAQALNVSSGGAPGEMTRDLLQTEAVLPLITDLVGDAALAEQLVGLPPLALFYGWLALSCVPALAVFTSCDAIAGELATGSSRFVLLRIDRASWALGKLAGQTVLLMLGVTAGGLSALGVGMASLGGVEPLETVGWMVILGGRAALYGFTWLGLALGISQLTRSVPLSRVMGLLALLVVGLAGGLAETEQVLEYAPVLIGTAGVLLPGTHDLTLWQPTLAARAPALVMLPALGLTYFFLGHAWFRRRDA